MKFNLSIIQLAEYGNNAVFHGENFEEGTALKFEGGYLMLLTYTEDGQCTKQPFIPHQDNYTQKFRVIRSIDELFKTK